MSGRFLWASAAIFVVLFLVTLWVLGRDKPVKGEPYFALKNRVPDTLLVAYGPDTTVLVPGGKTAWRVIRPVDYPADGVVVDAMLKRLADLPVEQRRFPLLEKKLDSYGFRYPRAMIRAAYRGRMAPDTLWIGAFTMNENYEYVRRGSDSDVALLDGRTVRTYLLKSTHDLRRTRLLPFHATRAVRFVLAGKGKGSRIEGVRRSDGTWWVKRPYPGPADSRRVLDYLTTLSHMHIREFLREDMERPQRYGLDAPRRTAWIMTASGDTLSVFLGNQVPGQDEVYARIGGEPQLVAVSDKYVKALGISDSLLRERNLIPFGLQRVDSVRVEEAAGGRTFMARNADHAEALDLRQELGAWVTARASDFQEATTEALRRSHLAPPRGRMFWLGGGDTLAVIDVGTVNQGQRAVRVSGGRYGRSAEILRVDERVIGDSWRKLSQARGKAGGGNRSGGRPVP